MKSRGPDSIYDKGRDIERVWVKSDGNYFYFAIGQNIYITNQANSNFSSHWILTLYKIRVE
jgi:hypothetical protein